MEIDITKFFNEAAPMDYSASQAEIGDGAGPATWAAAVEDAPDYNLLDTDEKRDAFRKFAGEAGAWSVEEIAAWSDNELNALFMQWVAGDIRESSLDESPVDWEEYEEGANAGRYAGRIFKGTDDNIYFYLGS